MSWAYSARCLPAPPVARVVRLPQQLTKHKCLRDRRPSGPHSRTVLARYWCAAPTRAHDGARIRRSRTIPAHRLWIEPFDLRNSSHPSMSRHTHVETMTSTGALASSSRARGPLDANSMLHSCLRSRKVRRIASRTSASSSTNRTRIMILAPRRPSRGHLSRRRRRTSAHRWAARMKNVVPFAAFGFQSQSFPPCLLTMTLRAIANP